MSARVKTPGTDVSSLVEELREQAEQEGAPEDDKAAAEGGADADAQPNSQADAQAESEGLAPDDAEGQEPRDPRLDVKVVDKAPCDRLDDLSQAGEEAPDELVRIVEGLIFASPHPLHVREAVQILEDYEPLAVQAAFKILSLGRPGSGLQLSRSAQGYRWTTDPAHAAYVQRLVMAKPQRLSRPQLETLAVIAYRQPVTRPEIDHIRGVDSQATIKALVDRDLISVVGQTADPGRPRLYGTTLFFLEYLNITELASLPPLGELDQLSDRTRELLRSKVGVDEAERLSAQVLALAKAQDQAAARGEDASQVVVDPSLRDLEAESSEDGASKEVVSEGDAAQEQAFGEEAMEEAVSGEHAQEDAAEQEAAAQDASEDEVVEEVASEENAAEDEVIEEEVASEENASGEDDAAEGGAIEEVVSEGEISEGEAVEEESSAEDASGDETVEEETSEDEAVEEETSEDAVSEDDESSQELASEDGSAPPEAAGELGHGDEDIEELDPADLEELDES